MGPQQLARPPATPRIAPRGPARAVAPQRRRRLAARALEGAYDPDATPPVALPLFPLPTCCLPSQTGVLHVFEGRFMLLFKDQLAAQQQAQQQQQQQQQQEHQEQREERQQKEQGQPTAPAPAPPLRRVEALGAGLRFGHVLAPEAAPPALLEGGVAGLPAVGVLATVTKIEEAEDGAALLVHYEGRRRFKLLAVDSEREPYPLAAVQWYDDDLASRPASDRANVDALERSLMSALSEVARLSRRLGAGQLPPGVLKYSPPPPPAARRTTADYLRAVGAPAGEAIAVWQRHGSVYGSKAARKEAPADPYEHLREKVAKERRQELFSFAAADCLDLGPIERLALLLSQDTAARLSYATAAARPFVSELAARAAVKGAVGGGGS